jgi:GntR family transcriptional regulator/MocR family aminotransferase
MSMDRRLRLLDLVRSRKAYVLEDDYDSEFRYFERPIASLQGLDGGANVIYLGTFSKALAPGLRTAYLVLPPTLVDAARICAPGLGQSVATPLQAALADFIDEGYLAAHIGRMRNLYAEKSHVLSSTLKRELHGDCIVPAPRGGLQLLVRLPEMADDEVLVERLGKAGIEAQSLTSLSMAPHGKGLLLGFAGPRVQEIAPAVRRLANIVNRHVAAIGHASP